MERLLTIGLTLIFIGFVLIIVSLLKHGKVEHGGLILIGPLPIVWGSSKVIVLLLLLTTIIILVFLILLNVIFL